MKTHGHFFRVASAARLILCYALAAIIAVFSATCPNSSSGGATTGIGQEVSQPHSASFRFVEDSRDTLPTFGARQEQGLAPLSPGVQLADNEEDEGEENSGDSEKDDATDSGGGEGNPDRIWDRVKRG